MSAFAIITVAGTNHTRIVNIDQTSYWEVEQNPKDPFVGYLKMYLVNVNAGCHITTNSMEEVYSTIFTAEAVEAANIRDAMLRNEHEEMNKEEPKEEKKKTPRKRAVRMIAEKATSAFPKDKAKK